MTDVADNIKGDKVHEQDGQLESDFFRSARLAKDKLDTVSLTNWIEQFLLSSTSAQN
jgi:hypothetical protein